MKKLRELTAVESCERLAYWESFGYETSKGINYFVSIAIKELLKGQRFLNLTLENLYNELDLLVSSELYSSLSEKKTALYLLAEQLERYAKFIKEEKMEILYTDIFRDITLKTGDIVNVRADLVLEKDDTMYVVKIKQSKPALSYAGRSNSTRPEYNIELYLLHLLGKEISKDKIVMGSYHHLRSKHDKSGDFAKVFNPKKGSNIIEFDFDTPVIIDDNEKYADRVLKNIAEISAISLSSVSPKAKSESSCTFCHFKALCKLEAKSSVIATEKEEGNGVGSLLLTGNQLEVINTYSGITRVNAGPGTGKTTTLAIRVAQLISEGTAPEEILLVTFTNKGAMEMKEKVAIWCKEYSVDESEYKKIKIMTFNMFGEKIIKANYGIFGFSEEPKLINKVEAIEIINRLVDKHPILYNFDYKNPTLDLGKAQGVTIKLYNMFNSIKAEYITNAEELAPKFSISNEEATQILSMYEDYEKMLVEDNFMDYQDQSNYLLTLIDEKPEALDEYSCMHIIVDEFQDTNVAQLDVVNYLADAEKLVSLMIIGDDSQSIYEFRGATPDNIINFHRLYPGLKDIFLVDNYRSSQKIVDIANCINSNIVNKIKKTIVSGRPEDTTEKIPNINAYINIEKEYEDIKRIIEDKNTSGVPFSEIAIIARRKSELFEIQKVLEKAGIPTVVDVTKPIIENPLFTILKNITEFFTNETIDSGIFEYIYALNKDKIDNGIIDNMTIASMTYSTKGDLLNKLQGVFDNKEILDIYFDFIGNLGELDKNIAGFIDILKEKKHNSVEEIFDYVSKMLKYNDDLSVDKQNYNIDAVNLLTAHSSKGREYDIVINTLNKYSLGSYVSDISEAELRVLFVSVTRAKKEIIFTCSEIPVPGKFTSNSKDILNILINNNLVRVKRYEHY